MEEVINYDECGFVLSYEDFLEGPRSNYTLTATVEEEEVARVHIAAAPEIGYYKIEYILFKYWDFRYNFGSTFVDILRQEIGYLGGKEICIYPSAETYEGIETAPIGEWYEYLEDIGFCFTEAEVDKSLPCRKMVLKI